MTQLALPNQQQPAEKGAWDARHPRWRARLIGAAVGAILTAYLMTIIFPILWIILSSFKRTVDTLTIPPVWVFKPTLDAYVNIFVKGNYLRYFTNSVVVSIGTTAVALVTGSLAAYALDRIKFPFSNIISYLLLSTRMIFPIVYAIPLFRLMNAADLLESPIGLIIAYTTFSLPYAVWIMQGFFNSIPTDLDDAAMIDGCSRLGAFWHVVLPLTMPGLAATCIFVLMLAWNEFLFALVLAGGGEAKTLPVATAQLVGQLGIDWSEMCAVATSAVLPMVIIFFILQKQFVRGMISGAVK